jgi:hypothetical protein
MDKWEYCAVVGIRAQAAGHSIDPHLPAVWYFTTKGLQISEIHGREADEIAKTVAQLGEDGWEMVAATEFDLGASHGTIPPLLPVSGFIFKRPKL